MIFLGCYILLKLYRSTRLSTWFKTVLQLSKTEFPHGPKSQVLSWSPSEQLFRYIILIFHIITTLKKPTTDILIPSILVPQYKHIFYESLEQSNLPYHEESSQHILGNCHLGRHHYTFSSILQFLQYKWL